MPPHGTHLDWTKFSYRGVWGPVTIIIHDLCLFVNRIWKLFIFLGYKYFTQSNTKSTKSDISQYIGLYNSSKLEFLGWM